MYDSSFCYLTESMCHAKKFKFTGGSTSTSLARDSTECTLSKGGFQLIMMVEFTSCSAIVIALDSVTKQRQIIEGMYTYLTAVKDQRNKSPRTPLGCPGFYNLCTAVVAR